MIKIVLLLLINFTALTHTSTPAGVIMGGNQTNHLKELEVKITQAEQALATFNEKYGQATSPEIESGRITLAYDLKQKKSYYNVCVRKAIAQEKQV
jgi:hypothetical protein